MRNLSSLGTMVLVIVLIVEIGNHDSHGQSAQTGDDTKLFIGTWRIVSDNSVGLMIYDAFGNMTAQVMPLRARPKYAGTEPTPDEAKAAITGYLAYFGTYTVDEREHTITHHRKGSINPGQVGEDAVRRYQFASDDQLILLPVESAAHIIWERVK